MSCKQRAVQTHEEQATVTRGHCNAVYYWKTTFRLSAEERGFLAAHGIGRMYLRYFDVYRDRDLTWETIPVPEATLQFIDTVPAGLEVIPTVFIDNSLFRDCNMLEYAEKITNRILVMSKTNDIAGVREVQLDCDWTQTTESDYFEFLKRVASLLEKDTVTLSVTARLHQLRTAVPPADRGVLMCYNTGGVRNHQTANSILDADDVAMYAKSVQNYGLPLDVAYPAFSWAVWFRGDNFQALLRNLSCENENITPLSDNRYKVTDGFYHEGKYLEEDDEIRFETSGYEQIMQSKQLLEKHLTDYGVIIYHLDYNNLSKFTEDEIRKIYSH
jgi:hypothetical protein